MKIQKLIKIVERLGILTVKSSVILGVLTVISAVSALLIIFMGFIFYEVHELFIRYGYPAIILGIVIIFLYIGILTLLKFIKEDHGKENYEYIFSTLLWIILSTAIMTLIFVIIMKLLIW